MCIGITKPKKARSEDGLLGSGQKGGNLDPKHFQNPSYHPESTDWVGGGLEKTPKSKFGTGPEGFGGAYGRGRNNPDFSSGPGKKMAVGQNLGGLSHQASSAVMSRKPLTRYGNGLSSHAH